MTSEKNSRKEKNQNIQVFVRLRPLNQRERDIKSLGVVEVVNQREVVVRQSPQTSHTKKFTFDRAFSPSAKQVEIYQDVVSPLIEEVLAGYNCTVFAYGQTGTGKTHTMVGEHTNDGTTWQNDPLAGIIPRALSQLFDELRLSNTEYTVRVSYLELYNEELFDLLSTSEDNSKLRIYEDVTRKGANIVNGLEEITVYNKNEVYKIMAQGQERKRVASTLMNAQSSRSHTVFTIVVHMKENSPEGEELVKIGKLNLVDLAGSENISKAGSDNPAKRERARECVNINQSLLTLGRVITALVERHPHIPYRESKLTRILQESLGGRTKTSIIATISPGHKDLEETMSTLEYAHRAKNIQNKPEVNQKMTKKAILKEYAEEIDRLKRDLQASRDKNGVYLANETYTELTLKQEEQKKEIQELLLQKRAMEEAKDKMEQVFNELNNQLQMKEVQLDSTIKKLDSTKEKLVNTSNMLTTTKLHYEEQKHLVNKQQETEVKLSEQARQLLTTAEVATTHVDNLHDTVDRRRVIESRNLEVTKAFRESSAQKRSVMETSVNTFTQHIEALVSTLKQYGECHNLETIEKQDQAKINIRALVQKIIEAMNEMKSLTESTQESLKEHTRFKREALQSYISEHSTKLQELLQSFVSSVSSSVCEAQSVEDTGKKNIQAFVEQWYSSSSSRVTSLRNSESKFTSSVSGNEAKRANSVKRLRDTRQLYSDRRDEALKTCLQDIAEERALIEQRLSKQMSDIATERQETEENLAAWVEEERKAFEERLQKHVKDQKNHLETRLAKKLAEIEEEKRLLEERLEKRMKWQENEIDRIREECEFEDGAVEEFNLGAEESKKLVDKFSKLFDDGTSAISIDMEAFSKNVLEIVEHITAGMMKSLYSAKDNVEVGASQLAASDLAGTAQYVADCDSIFNDILRDTKHTMDNFIRTVEENNQRTIKDLTQITAEADSQISLENKHLQSTVHTAEEMQFTSEQFRDNLKSELIAHESVEAKYLMQEYSVYSPSGNTPCRQQFGFPRNLAATSPHERILARFRAMRQNSDEDCVVLESDCDVRGVSDTESCVSEDSAVFAAPSLPSLPSPSEPSTVPTGHNIVKSTSDIDIYAMRRQQQQGKENHERISSSSKKPSRLPAPAPTSAAKRPLTERNIHS